MKLSIPVLFLLLCGVASAADPGATEAKLGKIREKIADVQKALQADTTQRDELAAHLRDAELSVADSRGKLDELRAQRLEGERRRNELQAERQQIETTLAAEREALAAELRAAHIMGGAIGRQEQLKLLLNQQNPAQIGRMFAYYS